MQKKKVSRLYRVLKWCLKKGYPKIEVVGLENLPNEPALYIGNHAQMNGPIICEFYFPVERRTWCAGQMMHIKEFPAYSFEDFWSRKPKYTHWFYKILSYILAPLSALIFSNAETIEVYKDSRLRTTIKDTLDTLEEKKSIVIFPEYHKPYNHILYDFQERFVDVARFHYRNTGVELPFVPIYIAPKMRKLFIGKPTRYCASAPVREERERLVTYLMEQITEIACSQPEHIVIPYENISKKDYPSNIPPTGGNA